MYHIEFPSLMNEMWSYWAVKFILVLTPSSIVSDPDREMTIVLLASVFAI